MDEDFLIGEFDDEEDEDDTAPDVQEPCPRCGRNHVALFYGQRYRTFEMHGPVAGIHRSFLNLSLSRLSMRNCMDCGYIELSREDILQQND